MCIVCGHLTLDGRTNWDDCPVCYWEDDTLPGKDESSPANGGLQVFAAQVNFIRLRACRPEDVLHVRSPRDSEPWSEKLDVVRVRSAA